MHVHFLTVVGGFVDVLPHTLRHYRLLGVESFLVHANVAGEDDPVLAQLRRITPLASVSWGPEAIERNPAIYRTAMSERPDDWFVLADQDELQDWDGRLFEVLDECDRHGFDHVHGTLVDRLARDGSFPPVDPERSLDEQFPLTALLTTPLLRANSRKIVAAKGHVLLAAGQHDAVSGRGRPVSELNVPVHHFKWAGNLIERLTQRVRFYREMGLPVGEESERLLAHVHAHGGRIDVNDPRFYVREASEGLDYWPRVREIVYRPAVDDSSSLR